MPIHKPEGQATRAAHLQKEHAIMATASKTATSPKVVLSTIKSPAEQKASALTAYLKAEAAADKASKKKGTAKGLLMAVTVHGERVVAEDGITARQIQNENTTTNGWEKLARELAAEAGLTEAAIAKRAKALGGNRKVQEVKTF